MAAHEEPRHEEPRTARPEETRRPRPESVGLVFAVRGPITRADIPPLCERLRRLLCDAGTDPVTVDVGECSTADLVTVEALARLRLTARRLGRRIRLGHADADLRRLLAWTGLDGEVRDATGPEPARSAGIEPRGQPEQRKQSGGVQERDDPGDPPP